MPKFSEPNISSYLFGSASKWPIKSDTLSENLNLVYHHCRLTMEPRPIDQNKINTILGIGNASHKTKNASQTEVDDWWVCWSCDWNTSQIKMIRQLPRTANAYAIKSTNQSFKPHPNIEWDVYSIRLNFAWSYETHRTFPTGGQCEPNSHSPCSCSWNVDGIFPCHESAGQRPLFLPSPSRTHSELSHLQQGCPSRLFHLYHAIHGADDGGSCEQLRHFFHSPAQRKLVLSNPIRSYPRLSLLLHPYSIKTPHIAWHEQCTNQECRGNWNTLINIHIKCLEGDSACSSPMDCEATAVHDGGFKAELCKSSDKATSITNAFNVKQATYQPHFIKKRHLYKIIMQPCFIKITPLL